MISSSSPHVRCTPMGRTCGEPNEVELTAIDVELNGSRRVPRDGRVRRFVVTVGCELRLRVRRTLQREPATDREPHVNPGRKPPSNAIPSNRPRGTRLQKPGRKLPCNGEPATDCEPHVKPRPEATIQCSTQQQKASSRPRATCKTQAGSHPVTQSPATDCGRHVPMSSVSDSLEAKERRWLKLAFMLLHPGVAFSCAAKRR